MLKNVLKILFGMLLLLFVAVCKNPNGPDEHESTRQISVEVRYERVAPIKTGPVADVALLGSRCLTPDGWVPSNPAARTLVEMGPIDEKNYVVNLLVWTTYDNILFVVDMKVSGQVDIAQNIYMNGVLLTKSEYGGPVGLYGRVRVKVGNDGSIIQP